MSVETSEARMWGRAIIVLAVCAFIFVWPWLIGEAAIPGVSKTQFYPNLLFLAQSWFAGDGASWNPYIFTGHPQIADPNSLMFSPYALLASLDANIGTRAFDAMTFLFLVMGGIGMIFFGRINHWHWVASTIAAMVFMFGGAAFWRIDETGLVLCYSLLPLALLYLELTLRRKHLVYAILAGIFMAGALLTRNHLALLSFYFFLTRIVWFYAAPPWRLESVKRGLLPLLIALFAAACICILPVMYTFDFLQMTGALDGAFADAAKSALRPIHYLTLIVPNLFASAGDAESFWGPASISWPDPSLNLRQNMPVLYAGALPVLLLGLILYPSFWRGRSILFCIASLAVFALYTLGSSTPLFRLVYDILPGAGFFAAPSDAAFLVNLLIAFLSGYLLNTFFTFRSNPAILLICGSVTILGGFWAAWMTAQEQAQMIVASPALLVSALTFVIGVFVLLLSRSLMTTWPHVGAAMLLLFVLVDLRLHNGPNTANAAPRKAYDLLDRYSDNAVIAALKQQLGPRQQNDIDRLEMSDMPREWSNAAMIHGFYNTLGDETLVLPWTSDTLGLTKGAATPGQRFVPSFPSYASPLPQMLGLRLALSRQTPGLSPAATGASQEPLGNFSLVKTDSAFPRVWLASSAQAVSARADILQNGFPALDYDTTVLLEDAPAVLPRFEREGSLTLRVYRHTEIEIEAQRTKGGYLVLSDAWHPWWQASIDNAPVKTYRANMMMRAVIVPAGSHVIRFRFMPACAVLHQLKLGFFCGT